MSAALKLVTNNTDDTACDPIPVPTQHRDAFFQELVNRYQSDLKRYAYWLSHDAHVAEDLVQETLMRTWRALDQLKDIRSAKGWLFTTLRRENARRFERFQPDFSDMELDELGSGVTGCDCESDSFMLRNVMERLPEDYRKPLMLQVVGGYGYQEISDMLGITQSAVTSRLFRARQKLVEMFSDQRMSGEPA